MQEYDIVTRKPASACCYLTLDGSSSSSSSSSAAASSSSGDSASAGKPRSSAEPQEKTEKELVQLTELTAGFVAFCVFCSDSFIHSFVCLFVFRLVGCVCPAETQNIRAVMCSEQYRQCTSRTCLQPSPTLQWLQASCTCWWCLCPTSSPHSPTMNRFVPAAALYSSLHNPTAMISNTQALTHIQNSIQQLAMPSEQIVQELERSCEWTQYKDNHINMLHNVLRFDRWSRQSYPSIREIPLVCLSSSFFLSFSLCFALRSFEEPIGLDWILLSFSLRHLSVSQTQLNNPERSFLRQPRQCPSTWWRRSTTRTCFASHCCTACSLPVACIVPKH